jgi:hypothetical protein
VREERRGNKPVAGAHALHALRPSQHEYSRHPPTTNMPRCAVPCRVMYDRATSLWTLLWKIVECHPRLKKLQGVFWSANQRFWKQMLMVGGDGDRAVWWQAVDQWQGKRGAKRAGQSNVLLMAQGPPCPSVCAVLHALLTAGLQGPPLRQDGSPGGAGRHGGGHWPAEHR